MRCVGDVARMGESRGVCRVLVGKPEVKRLLRRPKHIWEDIINPLNAKLNPICHLLALLKAHNILHVSRVRVKMDRQEVGCGVMDWIELAHNRDRR